MKRPAFQFYPADWRKDVELRSCSLAARGLWIDMLCIAHECDPYGHLTVNGKPMNAGQIAGQVGLTKQQCAALIEELTSNGVVRVAPDGAIYSKRMVDDERIRNIRAEAGRLGGNPNLLGKKVNQKATTKVNQKPTPSSSSSSSSSNHPLAPKGEPDGFVNFWTAWPKSHRKGGRDKCLDLWAAKRLEEQAAAILAHVTAMAATKDWTKDERQFVPAPLVYLRSTAWTGADMSEPETAFAGSV